MTKGAYRYGRDGRLNCRHGVMLYGDSCITCEREAETTMGQQVQKVWGTVFDECERSTAYYDGLRWHSRGDARLRHDHDLVWGDGTPLTIDEADLVSGFYRGGEIIIDPADHRGFDARSVGVSR